MWCVHSQSVAHRLKGWQAKGLGFLVERALDFGVGFVAIVVAFGVSAATCFKDACTRVYFSLCCTGCRMHFCTGRRRVLSMMVPDK